MIAPKKVSFVAIGIAACVMAIVIAIGTAVTDLGPWYQALTLPSWQPPGPVFGIVWTTIYLLTAASAVLAWRPVHTLSDATKMIFVFGLNCVLNVMWSSIFFGLHRPDWALYQVGFFWLSILALIIFVWPRTKLGAILLLPYVVWVSIASVLNFETVRLNMPFS